MLEPRHLAAERVDFRRNAIEIATALGLLARFFASTRRGIDGPVAVSGHIGDSSFSVLHCLA
jgi:hypothetical protein